MPVIRQKYIRRTDVRAHPDWLYVFGDNDARVGFGGQAYEMRGEPNAVGVRTKADPGTVIGRSYWSDDNYAENCRKVDEDLVRVRDYLANGGTVVIPEDGIGTGHAALGRFAPKTLNYVLRIINELK